MKRSGEVAACSLRSISNTTEREKQTEKEKKERKGAFNVVGWGRGERINYK